MFFFLRNVTSFTIFNKKAKIFVNRTLTNNILMLEARIRARLYMGSPLYVPALTTCYVLTRNTQTRKAEKTGKAGVIICSQHGTEKH